MAVTLYGDEFAIYTCDDQRQLVELTWTKASQNISEQQFRDSLLRLAELLQQDHIPNMCEAACGMASLSFSHDQDHSYQTKPAPTAVKER